MLHVPPPMLSIKDKESEEEDEEDEQETALTQRHLILCPAPAAPLLLLGRSHLIREKSW